MQKVIVAATQMSCSADQDQNIAKAEKFIREAASQGAQIILLQELFQTLYFCQVENPDFFNMAAEVENSRIVRHFASVARDLKVVLPISFFEKKIKLKETNNYELKKKKGKKVIRSASILGLKPSASSSAG